MVCVVYFIRVLPRHYSPLYVSAFLVRYFVFGVRDGVPYVHNVVSEVLGDNLNDGYVFVFVLDYLWFFDRFYGLFLNLFI